MPKVSADPGSPQSFTSTWKSWLATPFTVALPVNVACVFGPQGPLLKDSELKEVAFITAPLPWSRYSRFSFGVAPPLTRKLNVELPVPPLRLGMIAGSERRSPVGENTG